MTEDRHFKWSSEPLYMYLPVPRYEPTSSLFLLVCVTQCGNKLRRPSALVLYLEGIFVIESPIKSKQKYFISIIKC